MYREELDKLEKERIEKQKEAEELDRQFKKAIIEMSHNIEEMRYSLQALGMLRNIATDMESLKFCLSHIASVQELNRWPNNMENYVIKDVKNDETT